MGQSNYCATCHKYMLYPESHICPPAFDVWREDEQMDDSEVVYASDEEAAACRLAEERESDWDYCIARGSEVVVLVRLHGTEEAPKRFTVGGEAVIEYHAREEV